MFYSFFSKNECDTSLVALYIVKEILNQQPNKIITLEGCLGVGKTTLCKYITQYFLDTNIQVTSPTFNILNIYDHNDIFVYHYDCYRIKNSCEIAELGIEDALNADLTIIEWPNIVLSYLPKKHIKIRIVRCNNIVQFYLDNT